MLFHDYEKVHHGGIRSIYCTHDNSSLFTTEYNGILKEWDYTNKKLIKNYGTVHESGIQSVQSTRNSRYVYTSDEKGIVKQFLISDKKLVKTYKNIHTESIECLYMGEDFLITGSEMGHVSQYSINEPIVEDKEEIETEEMQQSIADVLALMKSGYFKKNTKSSGIDFSEVPEGEEKDWIKGHWDLFKSGAFKKPQKRLADAKQGIKGSGMREIGEDDAFYNDFGETAEDTVDAFINNIEISKMVESG